MREWLALRDKQRSLTRRSSRSPRAPHSSPPSGSRSLPTSRPARQTFRSLPRAHNTVRSQLPRWQRREALAQVLRAAHAARVDRLRRAAHPRRAAHLSPPTHPLARPTRPAPVEPARRDASDRRRAAPPDAARSADRHAPAARRHLRPVGCAGRLPGARRAACVPAGRGDRAGRAPAAAVRGSLAGTAPRARAHRPPTARDASQRGRRCAADRGGGGHPAGAGRDCPDRSAPCSGSSAPASRWR